MDFSKLRYEQLPWTDKYKPMSVNELYLNKNLKSKIKSFVDNKFFPNLILCGPPGVGKTAIAKCMARELYGKYGPKAVIEINASDGGVKVLHEEIVTFCRNKIPYDKNDKDNYANFKLVIIDASDNMDENKVQPQINNIMETHKTSVKFIFTCNTSSNLIESIQSRCLPLECEYVSEKLITNKLKSICDEEKINFEISGLTQISQISRGDVRAAINMLQLVKNKKNNIKIEYVCDLCDFPQQITIKNLINLVIKKDMKESINVVNELKQSGYSGSDITLGMIHTLKSDLCDDIQENIKIELFKQISYTIYRISKHTDSMLQLYSCIADMILVV